jgi:SAM-dependent methyltransferase
MKKKSINAYRLDACGWNSFRPELFFQDEGRRHRDIANDLIQIIKTYSKGNRVLELCSGGGQLLIQLARTGLKVTGIDLSKNMLDICRKNIEKESKAVQDRITIHQDDMCAFDLKETFDFIVLEDDGFMYLLTQKDQLSCLQRVRAHLTGNGLFFLSFATPQKELGSADEYEYDAISQIKTQPCAWTVLDKSGKQNIVKEGVERRKMTYPDELESLLALAKLLPVHRWGDMQMHPFTDPLTQEYNYLIKKQT